MSRLIDADKLIEEINNLGWRLYDTLTLKGLSIALETIKEQPTAFDVDKVVEQLEEKSKMNLKKGLIEVLPDEARPYLKAVESYDKAIEIVKRGGRDVESNKHR